MNVLGKPLGNLGNLEVEFDWPWEVANGKWLLYLTEIQTKGTSDSHCVPPGAIVNPLKLMVNLLEYYQGYFSGVLFIQNPSSWYINVNVFPILWFQMEILTSGPQLIMLLSI